MTLVLTAPSGPAGAVVELQTPGGTVLSHVASVTTGTAIADGSYVGQPVEWDGAAYVPLPPGDPLVLNQLNSQDGSALSILSDTEIDINSEGLATLAASTNLSLTSGGSMQIAANTSIQVSSTTLAFFNADVVVKQTIVGATTQLQVDSIVAALVAYGLAIDGR